MEKMYSVSASILTFTDHREFLREVVEELRARGEFSHRQFNRHCGFSSPNFLQLVIQGKRNLSPEAAKSVCRALGLSADEGRIFLKIMEMNLETTAEGRVRRLQALLKEPDFRRHHRLTEDQLAFYRQWYNVVLRELLVAHPSASAAELGRRLRPAVAEKDVEAALALMERLGLIERGEGCWVVRHENLSTGNDLGSQLLKCFHGAMMDLAKESMDRFASAEREISSLTLRLSAEDFARLKDRIREFKREILAMESAADGATVTQFNFQLFPVSLPIAEENP